MKNIFTPLLNIMYADDKVKNLYLSMFELERAQAIRSFIPAIISLGLITYLLQPTIPLSICLAWFIVAVIGQLIRPVTLALVARKYPGNHKRHIQVASCLAGFNGILHACAAVLAYPLGQIEFSIISIILVGMYSFTLVSLLGFPHIFIPYFLPSATTVVTLWTFKVYDALGVSYSILFGIIGLAHLGTYLSMGKRIFNTHKENFILNDRLDTALTEAQQSNDSKTRFLASASHDLRQPIHSINLFSAALSMESLSDRAHEIAKHISTASQTLSQELDSLLDLSKLDANMVAVEKSTLSVKQIFNRLEQEFIGSAMKKSLSLSFNSGDYCVYTDEISFQRILRNFIGNAIKYTDSGHVSVTADMHGDNLHITIKDTGVGVSDDDKTKIFEEFYQVDNNNRDKRRGIGLGLSIVKRLIDLLGFDIQLNSTLGQGSCFTLMISKEHLRDTGITPKTPLTVEDPAEFTNQKILIVDDEAAITKGMEYLLSVYEYDILAAVSYEEGLALGISEKPDLIISDYRLDEHDGIDLITKVREVHPHMHAFLVSGDTAPERLKAAQESGIELLHKPVDQKTLLRTTMSYLS